jgi:hypothetical protein
MATEVTEVFHRYESTIKLCRWEGRILRYSAQGPGPGGLVRARARATKLVDGCLPLGHRESHAGVGDKGFHKLRRCLRGWERHPELCPGHEVCEESLLVNFERRVKVRLTEGETLLNCLGIMLELSIQDRDRSRRVRIGSRNSRQRQSS